MREGIAWDYKVKVDRKTREDGRRQQVASNRSRKTRRPSETVAQGREAGEPIGEGGGEAKKRKKPHKSCRRDVGNGGALGGNRKKCRQENVGSVAADPANQGGKRKALMA